MGLFSFTRTLQMMMSLTTEKNSTDLFVVVVEVVYVVVATAKI